MATPVPMPRQGITVETCQILEWRKAKGDSITQGDILCLVETDKATFEVEAPVEGTVLDRFFEEGDDVPVLTNIAVIGNQGESYDEYRPSSADDSIQEKTSHEQVSESVITEESPAKVGQDGKVKISPRARKLAETQGISYESLVGTGPNGRIVEKDVQKILSSGQPLTPAAKEVLAAGGGWSPQSGTGIGGRVLSTDIQQGPRDTGQIVPSVSLEDRVHTIPVKGVRKRIAERMLASLQTTAQLTMNASSDATAILDYRKKLKTSPEDLGLSDITINDFLLFVTSRFLTLHQELNALFDGENILRYENIHLAFAVDTPRGLVVPVIRNAHLLNLRSMAREAKRLSQACMDETIGPDDLSGGTFTVTNLGHLGVESFTPILNPPQVGILGVSNIQLKAVQKGDETVHLPHISLSLTINHQVVDGAPAARFLRALVDGIAQFELMLAS